MNNIDPGEIKRLIQAEAQASRSGLNWAKANLGPDALASVRDKIIEGRMRMNRIENALSVNPAAAIFGESQVGKSYLVQNLLKNSKGVLDVMTDENGGTSNFILDLNPSGGGVESTSLITRFTERSQDTGNKDFPIPVRIFSPLDVALTLADSYFSDVQNHKFPEKEAILARIENLEAKYGSKPQIQEMLSEDHLYEMLDYLTHNSFPIVQYFISHLKATRYLERLGCLISSIPVEDWTDAFSLLWNDNKMVNDVFSRLIKLLETIGFPEYVGIQVASLMKVDGTILCVDRIKEFFGVVENEKGDPIEKARIPEMQVWTGEKVITVKKSEFTSIAAEVVLQVPKDANAPKPFMATLDILDFPGARSRMTFDEALISRQEVCTMLLRGRVSYLFNKYSGHYLISTLLFCHHEQKSEVMSLSGLLRSWIDDMVGATPQDRAQYLIGTKVPPLFIVSTKFNIDLTRDKTKEPANAGEDLMENEARHRWVRRYTNALSNIIQENADNRWFSEWVPAGAFNNLYLLRDYSYSDAVFSGYEETHRENDPDPAMVKYLDRLRRSFLNHEFVQTHFRNPAEAWERAATANMDGSEYIIENLVEASRHVVSARDKNFAGMVNENFFKIFDTLFSFYHDDNSDTMLTEALESAGRIELTLGILFGSKPYLFTEMLESMLVSEENLHGRILDVAKEMKLIEKTDLSILFAIRERAGVMPSLSRDENIDKILRAYHLRSQQDLEEYLKNFGYSIDDVINPPMVQNLPQILVESLENYWLNQYINPVNLAQFRKDGMPESALEDIAGNLRALYLEKLRITDRIIEKIHPYVTSPNRLASMAEMLADMVAEMFNKFVNTFGTAYFSKELWEDVADTVAHNKFEVEVKPTDYENTTLDEEQLRTDMNVVFDVFENIDKILNQVPIDSKKLAYFSNYHNFRAWTRNMKIGFLATCEIPKYDVNMNNELRAIILRNLFDNKDLHELIETSPRLQEIEKEMRAAVRN